MFCGSKSGADVNKLEETELETDSASKVDTPLIEDSVACFECEKVNSFETGDHVIFVGEVVAADVSDEYDEKVYMIEGWMDKGVDGLKTMSELK